MVPSHFFCKAWVYARYTATIKISVGTLFSFSYADLTSEWARNPWSCLNLTWTEKYLLICSDANVSSWNVCLICFWIRFTYSSAVWWSGVQGHWNILQPFSEYCHVLCQIWWHFWHKKYNMKKPVGEHFSFSPALLLTWKPSLFNNNELQRDRSMKLLNYHLSATSIVFIH